MLGIRRKRARSEPARHVRRGRGLTYHETISPAPNPSRRLLSSIDCIMKLMFDLARECAIEYDDGWLDYQNGHADDYIIDKATSYIGT